MLFRLVFAVLLAFTQARHFPMREQQAPAPFIIGSQDVSPIGKWLFMASIWVHFQSYVHPHMIYSCVYFLFIFKIMILNISSYGVEGVVWGRTLGGEGVQLPDIRQFKLYSRKLQQTVS